MNQDIFEGRRIQHYLLVKHVILGERFLETTRDFFDMLRTDDWIALTVVSNAYGMDCSNDKHG